MDVFPALRQLALAPEQNESLREQLAHYLNHLLLHDFPALVQLLYRVDVPEEKIKLALKENLNEDAGRLLADLLIVRQAEKERFRNDHSLPGELADEERW